MERLPDGTIEEILLFRERLEQETGEARLLAERDRNIMDDRSFVEFLDALNYTGFVEPFDYMAWAGQRSQTNGMQESSEEVRSMDLEELRKLLTMHLRIERFSEGHMQKLFEEGFFQKFFNRLEELKDGSVE